ncbi:MAG TPA: phytanoyl-CoA dioxygenase family protein [Sphingomonas sp.]|nr:phytanoyl-CoA dioxygenase family protein [Sphingomonas sp.]
MTAPVQATATLSDEQIDSFWRDGVVCVRQLYAPAWVERLTKALDEICAAPSPITGMPREGSFHSDVFTWLTNDDVFDFVVNGPSAAVIQQALRSTRINYFYDQIFVKEQMSPNPTPWHHDFTFWPLAGDQIASIWTSVDAVDAESSALEFVAGSHRWPQRYRAIGADGMDFTTGTKMDELPDINADRGKFDIVSWELEPGDALIFHALTLHGARGNRSRSTKRRAITTRWCGDDVTYHPKGMPMPYQTGLRPGDRLSGRIFPRILPELVTEDLAERSRGPILPDPALMPALVARMMTADRVPVPEDAM